MSDKPSDIADVAFKEAGLGTAEEEAAPSYRVMADSKIPVSKQRGKLWKSRLEAGRKAMSDAKDAWEEAITYYEMTQEGHRTDAGGRRVAAQSTARRLNNEFTATENVVFANVTAQIPELYAKNPVLELTAIARQGEAQSDPEDDVIVKFTAQCEKLINTIINKRMAPGVNLKPKAKRNVMMTLLANMAWFEVGYTKKEDSSEQVFAELEQLSKELQNAKTTKEITETEQKIAALEEKIEFVSPAGPYVRFRHPGQVIIDPIGVQNGDFTEATWIIIEDALPTAYINAVYGKPIKDDDTIVSVYEPTHLLGSNASDSADERNFNLFEKGKDFKAQGFEDEASFKAAQRTKVYYVWDKVTRRLELYSDKTWLWPIWVWDDPYQLDQFFTLVPLMFHDSPSGLYAKGEVSYYLDQQDAVNAINSEMMSALLWARRNIFFNKNKVTQEDADKVLQGDLEHAVGIDVPEGMKITDLVGSIVPPSMQFQQLFQKAPWYQAIDRIAATNDALRGAEFKTNTTNGAIDYYATQGNKRSDERLDAVEDAIAQVGWLLLQLCLRFMPIETAQKLIGEQIDPNQWQPIDPLDPTPMFTVQCVGGSTTKPSRQAKRQEAIQVGQVLAQYVRAAPRVVLPVSLRMMEEAFDGVTITREDWDAIETAITGEGGATGPGGAPTDPKQAALLVTQFLSQLPPQVLQAIGTALARGMPPQQILQQLMQGNGQQPNDPQQLQ